MIVCLAYIFNNNNNNIIIIIIMFGVALSGVVIKIHARFILLI